MVVIDASPRTARRTLLVTSMCVGMFLILLDVTIVNVALPALRAELHADAAGLLWVVDADTAVFACLLLTGGVLGDRFGHRRTVLVGLVGFAVASLWCALAPTTLLLIAGRVLQGIAGGLLLPQTLAIIAHAFPDERERAEVMGLWAGVSALALPAGPLLGGLLVDSAGWRWVFGVSAPICLIAALGAALSVPADRELRPVAIDLPSQVLVVVGLAAVVSAAIESGHVGVGWVVSGAMLGLVALAAFVRRQRHHPGALVPPRLARDRVFAAGNTVACLMNFGGTASILLMTLLLQVAGRRSPVLTALWLLPITMPTVLLSPWAGRWAGRAGPRVPMASGMGICALGGVLLALVTSAASVGLTIVAGVLIAVGFACNTGPMVAAVVGSVRSDERALAGGANNAARQVGAAIGVAVLGGIAGDPLSRSFLPRLHIAAAIGAAGWLAAAVVAARRMPKRVPA